MKTKPDATMKILMIVFMLFPVILFARPMEDTLKLRKELFGKLAQSKTEQDKCAAMLQIAAYYVDKPGEDAADMQSAWSYCTEAETINKQLNSADVQGATLTLRSQIKREGGDEAAGKQLAEQAIAQVKKMKDPEKMANAYFEMANYYGLETSETIARKVDLYTQAVQSLKKRNLPDLRLADALKYLADLNSIKNNYENAITLLWESLNVYQNLHYDRLQDVYGLMSICFARLGNTRDALQYGLMGIEKATYYRDSSVTTFTLYNRLGYLYGSLGDSPKEIESLTKALIFAQRNKDTSAIMMVMGNLGLAYNRGGHYREANAILLKGIKICPPEYTISKTVMLNSLTSLKTLQQQYALAGDYCAQMLKMIDGDTSADVQVRNAHATAIRYYVATKQFGLVPQHIQALRKINDKLYNVQSLATIENLEFQCDSAQGHLLSALQHYQRYKTLTDSIVRRNYDKQIAQLDIQHELRQKNKDLTTKTNRIDGLTKETQLQKKRIEDEKTIRTLFIIAVAMLACLLALAMNRYYLKQKSNQQLQCQQVEINNQNSTLKELLTEREWLLKEIHHRVKNNLQIVISLLNSQLSYLKNNAAIEVIRESKNRMNSISMIHQKLYHSDNVSSVNMQQYIMELTEYLQDSFQADNRVAFNLDVDPIMIDVSQAVPVGLILNETITNAIKYAFDKTRAGKISVIFKQQDGQYLLTIKDNGKGLPDNFNPGNCSSLGMSLMQGLSRQLNGKLHLTNDNGLTVQVAFKKAAVSVRQKEMSVSS